MKPRLLAAVLSVQLIYIAGESSESEEVDKDPVEQRYYKSLIRGLKANANEQRRQQSRSRQNVLAAPYAIPGMRWT